MSPEMHRLVVDRFGVAGHEAWRATQRRRRHRLMVRRVVRFAWWPIVIAAAWMILARAGWL